MKELCAAMAKAFPEIEGATKDKNNPHFRSKYADLGNVVDAIKPALVKNSLFWTQNMHDADNGVCVETVIHHASGESMSCGKLFVPASKHDAQGYGSALTYARRYSLMAAFGVAPEDDDGNAASKVPKARIEPVSTISARQADALLKLIEDTNSSVKALCDYYQVDSIPELPSDKYQHAVGVLEKRLPQKEAA